MAQSGITLVSSRSESVANAADAFPPALLALIEAAVSRFGGRRRALLQARMERQVRLDVGTEVFAFRTDTEELRRGSWRIAAIPTDLQRRRVEITGPVDPKMIINALNSGADTFMADFEDSNAPTWRNVVAGQLALREAARGTLRYEDTATKKQYALQDKRAVLLARPRGLHLPERHILVDQEPAPALFCDLLGYIFHNALELRARGSGAYFYIPKLERMEEAQLVDDLISFAEDRLQLPRGAVKVTVLIETLPAAFEMDEILFALKDHIVGLNCGRWDYIFSCIKRRRTDPGFVLPDRAQVTMEQPFLRAYSQLLIKTCHRRGAFAMGGMAAFIPVKGDEQKNQAAFDKVRADKRREASDGHDGTWVAHPGLVDVARAIFDEQLQGRPNQLDVLRDDVVVTAADLLRTPEGTRTEAGLRTNLRVGVAYLASWLDSNGCVPIDNLMEDAATAEISRTQIWQWRKHRTMIEGRPIDDNRLRQLLDEETAGLSGRRLDDAKQLFLEMCTRDTLEEFLTLPAYQILE